MLNGLKGLSAWLVYNKVVFSMMFLQRFNVAHNDQLAVIATLKNCNTLEEYKAVADQLNTDKVKKTFYSQAEAIGAFKQASETEQEKMLLEALTIVELTDDDAIRLLAIHKDANGVPYSRANVKSIPIADLMPLMLKTLVQCAQLQCDFSLLSEDETELFKKGRVNINEEANNILSKNAEIETGNLLSLAVKRIVSRFKVQ